MTTWICILSSTWDTCSSGRRGGYTFFQTILLMYLCWVHSVSLLLLFSLLSFLGKTNYCLVLHVLLCHECLELSAYDLTCAYLRVLIISILRPLNCAWNARRVCDATDTLRCLHDLSCHAFSLYLCIEWISLCFCPNVVHLTVRCLFDQTWWWHWCHSPFSASMATFVQNEWMVYHKEFCSSCLFGISCDSLWDMTTMIIRDATHSLQVFNFLLLSFPVEALPVNVHCSDSFFLRVYYTLCASIT